MQLIESLEPPSRPDLEFTLVRNGMDYLSSAVLYLTGNLKVPEEAADLWPEATRGLHPWPRHWVSDRYLKYGVLHLQAATEVLLKARLGREHWSLVFKDPGSATRGAYEQGKFDSCTMTAALDRLVGIVGVPITEKERKAIKDLGETRNALTHYGHTSNAFAVEARAARVLSFLVDFVPRQLHPVLSSEAEMVAETMRAVRFQLQDIQALVKNRMQELTGELKAVVKRTVICHVCWQWALVVGESPVTCRFCLRSYDSPADAAVDYMAYVLEDDPFGALNCSTCGTADVVTPASTAADKSHDVALCFHCGAVDARGSGEPSAP
ncbi:hypothetical protein ACFY7A_32760 [Streptomyces longwoodensis]|uniref:hypothetical protein n=1 Tax=Streptomyces TaxID=1883 RepID=UPI0036B152DF